MPTVVTQEEMAAQVLVEDLGVGVAFEGGQVKVRPLTMEQLLTPAVARDVAAIGGAVLSSIDKLEMLAKAPSLDGQALLELLLPVIEPLKRCLALCLDRPLATLPLWAAPDVFKGFFQANFFGPRLQPWVGLIMQAGDWIAAARKKPKATSETRSDSSSATGTPAGANTPPTSSSSTSGPP